jgi:syntaxin-binding protein 1
VIYEVRGCALTDSAVRYEFENASGVQQTMTATLSEADSLWVQTRHMHIKETIDKVISDLKAFQEQNGVFMKA